MRSNTQRSTSELTNLGKTAAELVDEKSRPYNFDIAEGCYLTFSHLQAFGPQNQDLRFRGQPLDPNQKLKLATNTIGKTAAAVTRCTRTRPWFIDRVKRYGIDH